MNEPERTDEQVNGPDATEPSEQPRRFRTRRRSRVVLSAADATSAIAVNAAVDSQRPADVAGEPGLAAVSPTDAEALDDDAVPAGASGAVLDAIVPVGGRDEPDAAVREAGEVRRTDGGGQVGQPGDPQAAAEDGENDDASAQGGAEGGEDQPRRRGRSRRRRGGRGRGRRSGGDTAPPDVEDEATSPDDEYDTGVAEDDAEGLAADEIGDRSGGAGLGNRSGGAGLGSRSGGAGLGIAPIEDGAGVEDAAVEETADEAEETADASALPTRLQARARSGRAGGARGAHGRAGSSGRNRRPLGGVSEETRRAVTEGPPRRMMVSVGEERTQIAVLEERDLVEHYVTRREDVSYVGNIYLGRVQNVLPGMEAAFIDIGKGRNGVLYAGEVNYDEADLETDLPRIEQTLKSGQTVLVQVTKDPMGTKGARLTQHLSIAGRYCVLAPGEGMLGISRKLTDDERERLRQILKGLRPEGYGLIVRTAAEGATREQLEGDIARLQRIWDQVNERANSANALEPVYEEPELVIRVIRDVFGTEYEQLVVDSEPLAEQVREYLRDISHDMADKVAVHDDEQHIFDAYEITNQIRRALERKVWLKSGGYLIVEKTEAMWVIDVNTGKFVGERNLEETVLRNNIEAAVEISRQLRLRDMGGIIVIDFVDMLLPANRDEVLKRFKRELARDKTKSRVMEISKLGLVQMTRKNVSQGLQESFTVRCDVCEGRGARIVESIV